MSETRPASPATWRDYARMARLEMAAVSLAPLAGALAVRGTELSGWQVASLHFFFIPLISAAIIHNDLMDYEFDRRLPHAAARPLAGGRIPRRHAWIAAAALVGIDAALLAFFYPHPVLIALIAGSIVGSALYNVLSKRLPGADFFFAFSGGLSCLCGAIIAQPPDARELYLPPLVWILSALTMFSQLFLNMVSGGLKDLPSDHQLGVQTLAVRLSRATPAGVDVHPAFRIGAVVLELIVIGLAWSPFIFLGKHNPWQLGVLALTSLGMLRSAVGIARTPVAQRERLMRHANHEVFAANFLFWVLVVDVAGVFWAVFGLFFPMAWFVGMNYLINGQFFKPPKYY